MIATVAGSYPKIPNLPRPAKLRQALHRIDRGEVGAEELSEVIRQVTREVIDEQCEAGLELVTDGQIRWEDGQTPFAQAIEGFSIDGLVRYFDTNTFYRRPILERAPEWSGPITVDDFKFATSYSPVPVKPLVTGPYTLMCLSENASVLSFEEAVLAVADILNQELRSLAEAGAEWIQVDEPCILVGPEDLALVQKAVRRLVEGVDAEVVLYTYFGTADGVYDGLLDLPISLLGLDFIRGQKNWELLSRKAPPMGLGLGVMDAQNTKMEEPEEIRDQTLRAADLVDPTRLHVNPHCSLEFLPREEAQAKLARLSEGVRLAREVLEP